MNTDKINFWALGITMVFAGSLLTYFESYRNSDYIFVVSYLLIFFGWITLFMQLIKGTIVDAKKIPFKQDRLKFVQQAIAKFFAYIILVAIIGCDIFYMMHLADNRRHEILENDPTKITVAEVNNIETTHGRNGGTYYHAIFIYKTADGHPVRYSWSEDKGDFLEGQKYEIQYAVEYPEMFKIIREMP